VPIFSNLSPEEMGEVASITSTKSFEKGQFVYRSGEKKEKLFVLHTGRVKIYRLSSDGREQVIRMVGPGQFIGELALFSKKASSDYAVAMESSTMCMIEGPALKGLMATHPSIGLKVMEELSGRLENSESLIEEITLHTVEQRLANFLLAESAGKDEFTLKMTKGDLASQLGMTQETLSRKLAVFQENRMVVLKGQRGIVIADREALEDVAGGGD